MSPTQSTRFPPAGATVHVIEAPGGGLDVTLTTPRLHLRSTRRCDVRDVCELYGDPIVMQRYMTGETLGADRIAPRVQLWASRWERGDPCSSFSVFSRESDQFLGLTILGHGDVPGHAELAFLFEPDHWGRGLGREAVGAVMSAWLPEMTRRGCSVNGVRLGTIVGTARRDNPASGRLLSGVGMRVVDRAIKWGAMRDHYRVDLQRPWETQL